MTKEQLLQKIETRAATVAVIGLGYVGLPLAVAFAEHGFSVVGIDVDPWKVGELNRGESYVQDIPSERLSGILPRFTATTDYAVLERCDAAIICVPTPLNKTRDPDVRYLIASGESVARYIHPGMLVVLESTTYPGTTVELLLPMLLGSGDRGQESGDRGQESGVRGQESGDRSQESGVRGQGSGVREQESGVRGQESGVRDQELPRSQSPVPQSPVPSRQSPVPQSPVPSPQPPVPSRQSPIPGVDFFLAFSPERIDPGRQDYMVENTPKVVGGVTPACREVAVALYGAAIQTIVPVSSTQAAEMVKLLENTFRAVNIALVNEVAIMCDKLGIDVWEVIDAAATKPYGFMKFTPGPGVGGHCIPLDPHYLSWKLKTLNYNARFIQLAGEINTDMPRYWVDKVQDALNQAGKAIKGSRVLVLGVAYKKDIDDLRESPALDIIALLRGKGADVRYHDPYIPALSHDGLGLTSEPDLDAALDAADCTLIVTDHSVYDWPAVLRRARLVVDSRHVG